MKICPCGSGENFDSCCGFLISGEGHVSSPEALMRSRFSAFATQNIDYIVETTDPQTRMQFDFAANKKWAEECKFEKLEILQAKEEGNKGVVEFKAHYRDSGGEIHIHHELSKFRKQAGIWFFREGKVLAES